MKLTVTPKLVESMKFAQKKLKSSIKRAEKLIELKYKRHGKGE